jgi:polar amino acid transport system substrate-binding protein
MGMRVACPSRCLAALFVGLLVLGVSAQACTKRLRWSDDPPYSQRQADGTVSGLAVELNRLVLHRMGCDVSLVEMPFARALTELRTGGLDILDGMYPLPERAEYAHFSQPQLRSRNLVYVRAADQGKAAGRSLRELFDAGWTVGAQVGVVYGPAYTVLQHDPRFPERVQLVPRRASLWQMLARGRVDVVMASENTAPTSCTRPG